MEIILQEAKGISEVYLGCNISHIPFGQQYLPTNILDIFFSFIYLTLTGQRAKYSILTTRYENKFLRRSKYLETRKSAATSCLKIESSARANQAAKFTPVSMTQNCTQNHSHQPRASLRQDDTFSQLLMPRVPDLSQGDL